MTPGAITAEVSGIVLERRFGALWWSAFGISAAMLLLGVVSSVWLFIAGIGIWGVDRPVAWGFAIMNYVWWIAIASGGTLTSAVFYLTGSEWRTGITRIAETMMLCGAACAAIYPILHLGRPYLFYWLFPYPATTGVWPQFRSPLLWDFFAILTYVLSSILFWYVSLIPDLATMRDRARSRFAWGIYGVMALGWRGSSRQWRIYKTGYGLIAAVMTPLVVSVHSIVGLDFAGGLAPGWHSTQFPPFFVLGALLSGFATVLAVAIAVRAGLRAEHLITDRHLDILARLILASSAAIALAYALEALMPFWSGDPAEQSLVLDRVSGEYAALYWASIACNVVAPQLLWLPALRRSPWLLFALCLAILYGMWCERYIIVVVTLHRDFLPAAWGSYRPTFWDWSTMIGTIGLFLTMLLGAVRVLPSFAMAELRAAAARKAPT